MAEYVLPARKHLEELCTNGLFLNLSSFPEPLKIEYQMLRNQIRDLRLPGAYAALADMASLCIHFPVAVIFAYAEYAWSPVEIEPLFRSVNHPQNLLADLKAFLDKRPDPLLALLIEAFEEAWKYFGAGSRFEEWKWRPAAGCLKELFDESSASDFITQVGLLNDYLNHQYRLYTHLKSTFENGKPGWLLKDRLFSAEPFLQYINHDYCIMEQIDPATHKMLCRFQSTHMMEYMPCDLLIATPQPADENEAQLLSGLLESESASEYLRPAFLDRWLSRALSARDRGYLQLETPEGMGKSVWCMMLDPRSPYYQAEASLQDYQVLRYTLSLYPDTQRPSVFVRTLSAMVPDLPEIEFTESIPDLRSRISVFLNDYAAMIAPRKLLILLDGMQHASYREGELCIHEILPQPAALSKGVYLLLTDHPEEKAHHRALLKKDPDTLFGQFSREHMEYQYHFRWYITQYVLHLPQEDDERVAALCTELKGDFTCAHILRDVYSLCVPGGQISMLEFFRQHNSLSALINTWIDQMTALYSAQYMEGFDCLLELLAIAPHPLSARDILNGALDRPNLLFMILRDLHPFLTFVDREHLVLSTDRMHFTVLTIFGSDWRRYAARYLQFCQARLSDADFTNPLRLSVLQNQLSEIDYYAYALGWNGHETLMLSLADSLLPLIRLGRTLPSSVVSFYRLIQDSCPDNVRNTYRLILLEAQSLSPDLSDRLNALNQWNTLLDSPLFRYEAFALSEDRYRALLSSEAPLSARTVEALCALRRRTQILSEDSFLFHTEKLQRDRLKQALLNPADFADPDDYSDPCDFDFVRDTFRDNLEKMQNLLQTFPHTGDFAMMNRTGQALELLRAQRSDLQWCAVQSDLLLGFAETFLRALLPQLCQKEVLEAAAAQWDAMRQHLSSLYVLRTEIAACIALTEKCPDPSDVFPSALYSISEAEKTRAQLLGTNMRLWLRSFSEKQQLAFFAENTPMWRTEEAMLRLESLSITPESFTGFVPKNAAERIDRMGLSEAFAEADRWYANTVYQACSFRNALAAKLSNELAAVELARARLALTGGQKDRLHDSLSQLMFYMEHGEISSRKLIDIICYMDDFLTADTAMHFESSDALSDLFASLASRAAGCTSYLSRKQIRMIQEGLTEQFPECLKAHHFYPFLVKIAVKNLAASKTPRQLSSELSAPTDALNQLIWALAWKKQCADPFKADEAIRSMVEEHAEAIAQLPDRERDDDLLNFMIHTALEMGSHHSFTHIFRSFWENSPEEELACVRMNTTASNEIYRRTAALFVATGSEIRLPDVIGKVLSREEHPQDRAFALLCLAICAGTQSRKAVMELTEAGLDVLKEAEDVHAPDTARLAGELLKLQILAISMDDAMNPEELREKVPLWIYAVQNAEAPLSLPFHLYSVLWNSPKKYAVSRELIALMRGSLQNPE